jgi:superoxide reductase
VGPRQWASAAAAGESKAGGDVAKRARACVCALCGNIVDVLHAGGGALWCCGQEMALLEEQLAEKVVNGSKENHLPVIEKVDGGYRVVVGTVPHPMEKDHYIVAIELEADRIVHRKLLNPGEKPEAPFRIATAGTVAAREHCNLHGLWKS